MQLFERRADRIFWTAIFVGVGVVISSIFLAYAMPRRDAAWNVGVPVPQPVPFSHDHHVGGLGVDCRYCHTSAARAAFAGMPSAETCMSCHSQIWTAAAVLEPVRRSAELGEPLEWQVVHNLPAFAYFHHGIHVAKGVACETCHGRIDLMPQTVKVETLSMGWCLDCHRNPEPHLRPAQALFAMGWAGESSADWSRSTYDGHAVRQLTDCSTCHR